MNDTLKGAVQKLEQSLQGETSGNKTGLSRALDAIGEATKVIDMGTQRVSNIVRRLRSFARLDEAELKIGDIHEGLDDTLALLHPQIKHDITMTKEYGDIPPVACYPGQLNQVFLNLLVNAHQAIVDKGEIFGKDLPEGRQGTRGDQGQRQRRSEGKTGEDLRPGLHDQGSGRGDRLRALYLLQDHARPPGRDSGGDRSRQRLDFYGGLSRRFGQATWAHLIGGSFDLGDELAGVVWLQGYSPANLER